MTESFTNVGGELGASIEHIVLRDAVKAETCCTRRLAVSRADGSLGRGLKCTDLENQSIIVRIVMLPSEGGSPMRKSTAM